LIDSITVHSTCILAMDGISISFSIRLSQTHTMSRQMNEGSCAESTAFLSQLLMCDLSKRVLG